MIITLKRHSFSLAIWLKFAFTHREIRQCFIDSFQLISAACANSSSQPCSLVGSHDSHVIIRPHACVWMDRVSWQIIWISDMPHFLLPSDCFISKQHLEFHKQVITCGASDNFFADVCPYFFSLCFSATALTTENLPNIFQCPFPAFIYQYNISSFLDTGKNWIKFNRFRAFRIWTMHNL